MTTPVFASSAHATHYAGDLAESGALGVLSLLIHVVPSTWATVLAWRFVPATAS